jgi:glutathione peroxidase
MGSDSAEKHRGRATASSCSSFFRLSVCLVAITCLGFFTYEPATAPVVTSQRMSHQLGGAKPQLERQNARRMRLDPAGLEDTPLADGTAQEEVVATRQAVSGTAVESGGRLDVGAGAPPALGLYRLSALDIDGVEQALHQYMGQVSIVVNVASKCGYTESNYKGLQAVYESFKDQGFTVLAFPCNQFGRQEPGSDAEVKAFAESKGATFPLFSKVDVNGDNASIIWEFLKLQPAFRDGGDIRWNFEKALVGRNGQVIKRYTSTWDDAAMREDIEAALKAPA